MAAKKTAKEQDRSAKLADRLRENLKKRKQQARGRTSVQPADDASPETDSKNTE